MLLFFTGLALALPPQLSEAELAEEAANAVLGEVITVDCLSSLEDENGVITNRFVATIDVEEVLFGQVPDQFQLVYTQDEYPDDYPEDNCELIDSHHPTGEIARYYLGEEENGMFPIYENGYFIVSASTADYPVCESLDNEDEPETPTEAEEDQNKTSSCAHVNRGSLLGMWIMGIGLVISRKRKRAK